MRIGTRLDRGNGGFFHAGKLGDSKLGKSIDLPTKGGIPSARELYLHSEIKDVLGKIICGNRKVGMILAENDITTVARLKESSRGKLLSLLDVRSLNNIEFELSKLETDRTGRLTYFRFKD